MLALQGTFASWETLDCLVSTRYVIDLLKPHKTLVVASIQVLSLPMPVNLPGKLYASNRSISSHWRQFLWLSVNFIKENKYEDSKSTLAISLMLLHKLCVNSIHIWHLFSAHKTHIHFEQNAKLFYCLQRHSLTFSILWHSTICCSDLWVW